nr:MAG TPA: zinc finger domain-containing protein [Caudoviricetes sp.]
MAAKARLVHLLNQDIPDPIQCIRYVICIKR